MNIFNKVALQGLKKSRTRTIVTIIGVMLSSAMIMAVVTFGVSLLSYLADGAAQRYGSWHAGFIGVPYSFVEEHMEDKGVSDVAMLENTGYAVLEGSKTPERPYLFIAGYSDETFRMLPVTLVSGRLPENSSEVVISGGIASKGGVKIPVGSSITLNIGKRSSEDRSLGQNDPYKAGKETFIPQQKKTYTVVGICQKPYYEEDYSPGYTIITKTDKAYKAESFNFFVKLENPYSVRSYINNISGKYSYVLNDNMLRFMGISDDDIFNILLYSVGVIVILIVMAGSVFMIYNAFNISLNERTHQFGILLSVGATEKQLRNSVLFEGFCIGMAGIPAGILIGAAGINTVITIVAKNFESIMYDTPLKMVISAPAIIVSVATSLITIMVSAYIPARKAAAVPVMDCIRQTNEIKFEAKNVKTSKLASRLYGLEGMIALKNFKRNKKRYRSIVLSLVLSVVLFISSNSFVIYLKQASEMAVVFTTYDIGLSAKEMEDDNMEALYNKLKTVDGVYGGMYQALAKYTCTVGTDSITDGLKEVLDVKTDDKSADLSLNIQFINDNAYFDIIKKLGLAESDYTGNEAKFISIAKLEDNTQRVKMPEDFSNMFKGNSEDFTIIPAGTSHGTDGNGKEITVTFEEFVAPDVLPDMEDTSASQTPGYIFIVFAPYSLKDNFEITDANKGAKGITFCSENASKAIEDIEMKILAEGVTDNYNLFNVNNMMEYNINMVFIANVFAYTFIVMISLIAAANVFNTISTNIKLRRRELAMLRSIGISERGFQKMMNFECAFYGIRALGCGLPLAIAFSWLIYMGMSSGGADDINFVIPWAGIGISIFSVLFIVFITMLYATSKIRKENIIDALRDDME
ncbi:MAG: ABC transporter permease [Lachnospiraceae bacterium]|nr:ABC transporter permease [Lachnospiraceae bacterium]